VKIRSLNVIGNWEHLY